MSEPKRKPATYEDVLRAPEHMVAEIVEGDLYLSPRPAKPHAVASAELFSELHSPFSRSKGGPGGWVILVEPEVHFGPHVLVPDLAGWRKEREPLEGDEPYFTVVPDWVCEVVSPSTGRLDRIKKLPLYAANDVRHAWLVDPIQRSLEVYRNQDRRWVLTATHADQEEVRVEPFEAVALELAALWI
jgi:Uma2 family endonuclease